MKSIREVTEDAVYYEQARIVVIKRREVAASEKVIAVVTAGTSDIPVAGGSCRNGGSDGKQSGQDI